ncbi:probable protein phosphatase 2C 55 [Typha latifolia]|uniref:probable protein phosphatase 2C 55 n=1 Tax=Typha latifolia TaxID=4733 RepID=UPI003C30592D
MPSSYFSNQKEFLLGRGRSFLFGNTWFFLSRPSPPLGHSNIHLFPKCSFSVTRDFHSSSSPWTLTPTLSEHSVSSSYNKRSPSTFFARSIMSVCNNLVGKSKFGVRHYENSSTNSFGMRADVCYSYKGLHYGRRVSGSLKSREPWGNNMVYKCFWSNASGNTWNFNISQETGFQDFLSSNAKRFSAGAASGVSFDGAPLEEHLENSEVSCEQKPLDTKSLKLLSGSCYLPHPDKEETGGEDAHFICVDEQAIGVADGVGGWADLGVDAGQYARELMSNSVSAIQKEPKGFVDPARVLEKAYSSTKARGSSTACIIALTDQGIHAVNLGDSGFIVVREGCTIFRSPVQQHDFNFTYQLESGNGSDLPSSAQVFNFPVASGDVIIAGTDGLFDNLYSNEVTAVVVHAIRAGLGPQVTAQKIAALARQRAVDRNRQTPFSTAAQDAGYRYYGGKLDDITVVVSYITANSNA